MLKVCCLEFQYHLSKRKALQKPSRTLSSRSDQSFSLSRAYQPNSGEMQRVFNKFDADRDGKISTNEYRAVMMALDKGNMIKDVAKIFEVADLDRDGFISFEEFMEVQGREGGVKYMDIELAFRTFDSNGDGKITGEEVFEVLKRIGEECSLQECRRMVRAVDADGDGVIGMDDFMHMMTHTKKPY